MARTSHRPFTARHLGAGTLAACLALAVLPAVASPAEAEVAATTLTSEQLISRLKTVSADAQAAMNATGASAVTAGSSGSGARAESFTVRRDVDVARGTARSAATFKGGGAPIVNLSAEEFDEFDESDDPCVLDEFTMSGSELMVERAGVGTYRSVGTPPSKLVKSARKLVKRPKAAWLLKKSSGKTKASLVAATDPVMDLLVSLGLSGFVTLDGASETSTAGGVSIVVNYTALGLLAYHVTVEIPTGKPVAKVVTTMKLVAEAPEGGASDSMTTTTEMTYAAQSAPVPAAKTVVDKKKLRQGCVAAGTRDTVKKVARDVAKRLNKKKGAKTQVNVRRAVNGALSNAPGDLRIQNDVVAGGVVLTGKHKLLKKTVVRRILVVDGKVVVRNGAGR